MTFKHGLSGKKSYKVWKSMRERCNNDKHHAVDRYGGRGIEVCTEWDDFAVFYADMGDPPSSLSLERRDNDGPSNATNCMWATRKEQQNNLRSNLRLEYDGKTQTLRQWAEELCANYQTLWHRIYRRGWSIEQALGG